MKKTDGKLKKRRRDRLVEGILDLRPDIVLKEKRTVDDFAQDLLTSMEMIGYCKGTIKNYKTMYDHFFFETLKSTEIQVALKSTIYSNLDALYLKGFVYEYRVIAYTVLNHIFNYALALGYITENPCDSIDMKV